MKKPKTFKQRVGKMFRRLMCRDPKPREMKESLAFINAAIQVSNKKSENRKIQEAFSLLSKGLGCNKCIPCLSTLPSIPPENPQTILDEFSSFLKREKYPQKLIKKVAKKFAHTDAERIKEAQRERQLEWAKDQNGHKPAGVNREKIGDKKSLEYSSEYYETEDWRTRSQELKQKAGGFCCKCQEQGGILTIHHMTYAYRPHTEPEEILECVCKSCHTLIHEINKIVHQHQSKNIDSNVYIDKRHYEKIIKAIDKYAPWLIEDNDFENIKILERYERFDSNFDSKLSYLQKKVDTFLNLEKIHKINNNVKELNEEKQKIENNKLWMRNAPHLIQQ